MGQYRLWLHYRAIDQSLQEQQTTHKQELSEIDQCVARIEKTAPSTNNAILTMLMQQINLQERLTDHITDTTDAKPEHPHINTNHQIYQTLPPSNYGQEGSNLQMIDPGPAPQPIHVFPDLLAWNHLPNFAVQDIHIPEEPSQVPISTLPAATDRHLPGDLHTSPEPHPQANEQLPWWLRNLLQSPQEEQEPPQTTPQRRGGGQDWSLSGASLYPGTGPHPQIDQGAGHWFARRTRLVHYDE